MVGYGGSDGGYIVGEDLCIEDGFGLEEVEYSFQRAKFRGHRYSQT